VREKTSFWDVNILQSTITDSDALHKLLLPESPKCAFQHRFFFHEISARKIILFVLFCFLLLHDSLLPDEARPALTTRLRWVETRTASVTLILRLIAETVALLTAAIPLASAGIC